MSTHDNGTRGRDTAYGRSARRRLTDQGWEEGEGLRRRMDWIRGLLGTDDVTRVLRENDRFRGRRPTTRSQGRATADPGGPFPESGQDVVSSLPDSQANLRVTRCESLDDFQGFGRTGACVEVAAAQPFASALVRFKLHQEQISHLHPGSIAVARWDKVAER